MSNVISLGDYKHFKKHYGRGALTQLGKWQTYFNRIWGKKMEKEKPKRPEFQVKVIPDLLNGGKVFRLYFQDKMMGLGHMEALKKTSDEDMGAFLTEALNCAFTLIQNEVKTT